VQQPTGVGLGVGSGVGAIVSQMIPQMSRLSTQTTSLSLHSSGDRVPSVHSVGNSGRQVGQSRPHSSSVQTVDPPIVQSRVPSKQPGGYSTQQLIGVGAGVGSGVGAIVSQMIPQMSRLSTQTTSLSLHSSGDRVPSVHSVGNSGRQVGQISQQLPSVQTVSPAEQSRVPSKHPGGYSTQHPTGVGRDVGFGVGLDVGFAGVGFGDVKLLDITSSTNLDQNSVSSLRSGSETPLFVTVILCASFLVTLILCTLMF